MQKKGELNILEGTAHGKIRLYNNICFTSYAKAHMYKTIHTHLHACVSDPDKRFVHLFLGLGENILNLFCLYHYQSLVFIIKLKQ